MFGPGSSIVENYTSQARNVSAAPTDEKKKNSDPNIWIGGRPVNYASGRTVVDREVMPLSTMVQKVKSAGARRLPTYYELADKLVKSRFMAESSARYPGGVAGGLTNAADVYQAYSADGGTLNFTQWLDWYSSGSEAKDGSGGRGGRGGYSGPTTTTAVTLTDEVSAEALLDQFARDLLGRGLTQKETSKYLKQFRKSEMESPQVTTTTPTGRGTATQVTETAASKDELLRDMIASNPDYQKFQVDTTIMDMLMEDIEKGKKVIYG